MLRNGASLLAERVWLPPDRRKPTRLRLRFEDPLLLLPRNVHALRSEESLAEASVSCELVAIDVSKSDSSKAYLMFHPKGPNLRLSKTFAWKKHKPLSNLLKASGLEQVSNSSGLTKF